MDGYIHSLESFGTVDGPGLRFVIFCQGCPLRCQYCHNPDSWAVGRGTRMSPEALMAQYARNKAFYGNGGITVTGGEPLLQIDFLLEFFQKAKAAGVSTCIDTAGEPFTREEPWFSKFRELMKVTDLLLVDIKQIDRAKHIALTGKPNDNILDMFQCLSDWNKPIWIRQVLVPGWTDDPEDLAREAAFIRTLSNVKKVEVLPYHTMGAYKWEKLGIPYPLAGVNPPDGSAVARAEQILRGEG